MLSPQDGPAGYLHGLRSGRIRGKREQDGATASFQIDAGELFPVGAAMARRAVTTLYRAEEDTLCLLLPQADMHEGAAQSLALADVLNARMPRLLELSCRAWSAS